MDGGAWWAAVHGVAKSRTRLSDFTFTFHFHALEKQMATRSSVLAWRIPGMWEPGGLPSMGSHRAGHDWSDLAAAASVLAWRIPGMGACGLPPMGSQSRTRLMQLSSSSSSSPYSNMCYTVTSISSIWRISWGFLCFMSSEVYKEHKL